MKKYVLTERVWKSKNTKTSSFGAGTKAMQDIEKIVVGNGFEPMYIYSYTQKDSFIAHIVNQLWTAASWMHLAFKIKKDDILLIQCPLHRRQTGRFFAQKIANKKGHVVSLTHDIEELRQIFKLKKNDIKEFEITLSESEFIIAHNYAMKQYLVERGFAENKIIELELFDYLTDKVPEERKNIAAGAIAIAGNCSREKSAYLYQLDHINWKFELYGLNYETEFQAENIHYNGAVEAGMLPCVINGSYGLVWDGKEINTCTGQTGKYMRYNNPHKTSLYAAAGLPIIIWEEAAMAKFVKQNKIGLTVASLNEIEEKLNSISESQYDEMRQNVLNISEKVRSGYFVLKALKKVEDMI